ncbi:MAG: hypothetical protein Q4Q04_01730 [Methanocorpusculum sp.]|nr:hypothetical protein [Methanocorpusculum sp.]
MGTIEDKRAKLIWASVVLMFGVALIAVLTVPTLGFWDGAGIFLVGVGSIATLLTLFMGKAGSPVFPLLLILAGVVLLANGILTGIFPALSFGVIIGIAIVIVAVGSIISIIMRK